MEVSIEEKDMPEVCLEPTLPHEPRDSATLDGHNIAVWEPFALQYQ